MEGPPRHGPLFSAVPWPSLSAVHLATIGISAALYVREITGLGQWVTTSLLQGALINGTFTWQRVARPERPGYRMWVTDPRVPHGFFRTNDDRWVHNWTPQPGFVLNAIHEGKLRPGSKLRAAVNAKVVDGDSETETLGGLWSSENETMALEAILPVGKEQPI